MSWADHGFREEKGRDRWGSFDYVVEYHYRAWYGEWLVFDARDWGAAAANCGPQPDPVATLRNREAVWAWVELRRGDQHIQQAR